MRAPPGEPAAGPGEAGVIGFPGVKIEAKRSYRPAARQRAEEKFDVRPWLQRHREVFEDLVR